MYFKNADVCRLTLDAAVSAASSPRKRFYPPRALAAPTTSGIVSIEHSVDKATRLTESRASCPYRVANMVVAAAAGALAAITQAVRSAPRMPAEVEQAEG